jgi:hypothetical protein
MRLWELNSSTRSWPLEDRRDPEDKPCQINELFDQPYEWEWIKTPMGQPAAEFQTDSETYFVEFTTFQNGQTMFYFESDEYGDDISGAGDQFRVFATVYQILDEYLRKNNVKWLHFTGDEPSRVKLYKRFAEKISKKYDMKLEIGTHSGQTTFDLFSESINEEGKIVPNVNTTVDVQPGETQRQAAKFGNKLDDKSRPPLLRGSYGDDSARFSANQGDPFYGPDGTRLTKNKKWS